MSGPKPNKALELLTKGVEELMSGESWKAVLEFRAKLHNYSFNNCWLIQLQAPQATMVAGFNRWKTLGRHVKKGEKGIAILAPLVRKAEADDGNEERRCFGFKTAYVFDVSQTEGEPVPELTAPELLIEDSEQIRQHITDLETCAERIGSPVERRDTGRALGSYNRLTKGITLRLDLPPLQTLKTLVHELAHALLHSEGQSEERHTLELEAESCAYLVCYSLGLDTSRYSCAYLASWADDVAELLPAGERALKAADDIMGALVVPYSAQVSA